MKTFLCGEKYNNFQNAVSACDDEEDEDDEAADLQTIPGTPAKQL